MGTSVANVGEPNGFRHKTRIGTKLVAVEEKIHYHFGNAGIDTLSPTVYQQGIADLHDAALLGAQDFATTAAGIFGSWWTALLSDADTAGLQGTGDDPRRVLRTHYADPVETTIL